ncbi:Ubiquitin carboxyl-terminal hydrolase MINDY-2 [Bienertia sinuspersici]
MGDLVSLETRKMEKESKDKCDEDCIDFAAATTATLGVPSPCLSRGKSFEESPRSDSDQQACRKGDTEEEAELLRVLKLSEGDSNKEATSAEDVLKFSDENAHLLEKIPVNSLHVSEGHINSGVLNLEPSVSGSDKVHGNFDIPSSEEQTTSLSLTDDGEKPIDQLISVQHGEVSLPNDLTNCNTDTLILDEVTPSVPVNGAVYDQEAKSFSTPVMDSINGLNNKSGEESFGVIGGHVDSESSSGGMPSIEAVESFTSSLDGSEPIYEGEECILDSGKTVCEDREPVYEGEMVLAEQADKGTKDACDDSPKDEITHKQGELINNFLESNANQLTFFGLFSLQDGLKERELCVFFRNNHFSTMFKLEDELYLLATDQGYMNQPDLVWEKLNEVNGDTLFMTSNFKEFRLESSSSGTWDQQNAVSSTADYLASIDSSATDSSNMNSDLQLAIALQQQEFEQQQQQQQRNPPQQASGIGSSRLVTGPQIPRSSAKPTSSTPRQDQKSKDKSNCKIM